MWPLVLSGIVSQVESFFLYFSFSIFLSLFFLSFLFHNKREKEKRREREAIRSHLPFVVLILIRVISKYAPQDWVCLDNEYG
ncbi:uncharacterized protein BDW43DRAFT_280488, partial [Aspergillus alliaceus]|uniref:uncharacterized protein n=1 Tax=Petromyces alliaceus TaxID=209559 RepID=UPI0012A465D1